MSTRHALALFALVTAALASAPTSAQTPSPLQEPLKEGVVLKGKAPVSDTMLQVRLPRPQEADLPNGLHVMVLEDRRAPQVTVQLVIRGWRSSPLQTSARVRRRGPLRRSRSNSNGWRRRSTSRAGCRPRTRSSRPER
jgi:hypothetical protein